MNATFGAVYGRHEFAPLVRVAMAIAAWMMAGQQQFGTDMPTERVRQAV